MGPSGERSDKASGVHQVISFRGGELDQAYLLAICEQAIQLGIHGDGFAGQPGFAPAASAHLVW